MPPKLVSSSSTGLIADTHIRDNESFTKCPPGPPRPLAICDTCTRHSIHLHNPTRIFPFRKLLPTQIVNNACDLCGSVLVMSKTGLEWTGEEMARNGITKRVHASGILCVYCQLRFSPEKLLQHSIIHTNQLPFDCHTCSASFETFDQLSQHACQ